jgi:hypothetical protein
LRAGGENRRNATRARDAAGNDDRGRHRVEHDLQERQRSDGSGVAARLRSLHDDEIDAGGLSDERIGSRLHVCRDARDRIRGSDTDGTERARIRNGACQFSERDVRHRCTDQRIAERPRFREQRAQHALKHTPPSALRRP